MMNQWDMKLLKDSWILMESVLIKITSHPCFNILPVMGKHSIPDDSPKPHGDGVLGLPWFNLKSGSIQKFGDG